MYRTAAAPEAPHPLLLRALAGGRGNLAGLSVAPHIPLKKLQGARSFAQVMDHEQPLALVDTSVLQSGKSGMLVTNAAVYFDSPRARVPIEVITSLALERSDATVAHLQTPMGAITLPSSAPEEALDAMVAVLQAVALSNRGASRFAMSAAPVPGPVGELACATLVAPLLGVAPSAPRAAVHSASNVAPTWMDHDRAESLLCFVDETVSLDGTRGLALTDRRLIAFGERAADVPYAALQGVSLKSGMLSTTLRLATHQGVFEVSTGAPQESAQAIFAFLNGLGALHPGARHAELPINPGADDPSGAVAAMRTLTQPDPRVASLLELIHGGAAQGSLDRETAGDLTRRALRLQRCLRDGHGRTGVMQRSPLAAADLSALFTLLLGAPVRSGYEANGQVMDFDLGGSSGIAGTVASNVVGLTLLAVVGVGWVSTGGGSSRTVRVRVWDGPSGAGFSLAEASGAPLAQSAAKVAAAVLTSLASRGAEVLLRRVVSGWSAPLPALFSEPIESVAARARTIVPHFDVALFSMSER